MKTDKLLERQIVWPAINELRNRGFRCLKLDLDFDSGWPDWLILGPYRFSFQAEFKRPGKTPEPHQQEKLDLLRRMGHYAEFFDNAGKAIDVVCRAFAEAKAARGGKVPAEPP